MKKNKKRTFIIALLVLLLALAVGYAAFGETLTISGTANAKGTFDLAFTKGTVDKVTGADSVGTKITPSEDGNTMNVVVKDLAYPGAGVQFTATITNKGTMPAKLTGLTPEGVNQKDIKVTFPEMSTGEIIQPNATCNVTFTVEWDKTSTTAKPGDQAFSLTLDYEQDTTEYKGQASHTDAPGK